MEVFSLDLKGNLVHLNSWKLIHLTKDNLDAPFNGLLFLIASYSPESEFPNNTTVETRFYGIISIQSDSEYSCQSFTPYLLLLRILK